MEDESLSNLEIGMPVALDVDRYRERPLIGEVREIEHETLVVAWYGGSWSTKWSLVKRKDGREVGRVDRRSGEKKEVVLFDFNLTGVGKLRLPTIRHLRDVYGMSGDSDSITESTAKFHRAHV